jgi:hypothetical protein
VVCGEDLLITTPNGDFPSLTVVESEPETLPTDFSLASKVFDVSFSNETITDFSVTLCFASNATQHACLGYLDETLSPPQWKCEDACLRQNNDGQLCGDTSHFTNFAILFSGTNVNGNDCKSSTFNYITGSGYGDLMLILIFAGTVVVCGILFILFGALTSPGKRLIKGTEGLRVEDLRKSATTNLNNT